MSSTAQNTFPDWYKKWQQLAKFTGSNLDGKEWTRRINEIIRIWSEEPPTDWKRKLETDFKERDLCTRDIIYCRSDRETPHPGEHRIENHIIYKDNIIFFSREYCFKPIVNAFPCSKDSRGGRKGNVEIDLLGILTNGLEIHPVLCEIKWKSNNPWYAAVENLRQLRLFIDNADNLEFIRKKLGDNRMKFVAPVGIVIAEPDYYKTPGQKLNSMKPTQDMLERLQAQCKAARVVLATWDKNSSLIDRVGGCELNVALSP